MNDERRAEVVLAFDDDGIDHLLAGDAAVADDLRAIAPLLAAARRPATADELADEAGFTALFREVHAAKAAGGRRRSLGIKVVAIAGALTVVSATGAAAAGGLPEPVQDTAAALLATVGISVPTADEPPPREEPVATTTVAPAPPPTDVEPAASSDAVSSTDTTVVPDVAAAIPETPSAPTPTDAVPGREGTPHADTPEPPGPSDEHGKEAAPDQPQNRGKPDNPGKRDKPVKPEKP
jgi:hypothetical protein